MSLRAKSVILALWAISGLLMPDRISAQIFDDFADNEILNNPTWAGNVDSFVVNTDGRLQSQGTVAGQLWLSTPLVDGNLNDREWSIYVNQSFAASSSNYGRVYLASDQMDVSGPLNGYYLQFGEALSNDAVELFRQSGGSSVSICRGPDAQIASSFAVRVRVRRDATGNWQLDIDPTGGTSYVPAANGTDATYGSLAHMGMLAVYTVSNADNFVYDDVYYGPWVFDTQAPTVLAVSVTGASTVDVSFSEPVDQTTAQNSLNYSADNGAPIVSTAVRDAVDPTLVHLTFGGTFANGTTYNLTIVNVTDLSANAMAQATLPFTYVIPEAAVWRDVVINEFIADPNPVVNMPDAEYVEILNTSAKYIDLTGWKLTDGSSNGTLQTHILAPGENLLLVSTTSADLFAFFPDVLLVSSFPSLNNTGDLIRLSDAAGTVIDQIVYDGPWFYDEVKADGGWAFEQVNATLQCSGRTNWRYSEHPNGGTPGQTNSVSDTTPDLTGPAVTGVQLAAADTARIRFTEPVDTVPLSGIIPMYVSSPPLTIVDVLWDSIQTDVLTFVFSPPLDTGVVYTVGMVAPADCQGNAADTVIFSIELPFAPRMGDLIINEVLFDPYTDGEDYVEIYNKSDRTVDLRGIALANFDDDTIWNFKEITADVWPLRPREFAVITEDSTVNQATYINHGIGNWIIIPTMPSYNNDSSTVYLIMANDSVADRFTYTTDMHFPLLNPDGVSLERIDPSRPSSDPTNWHSAAQEYGFGTPGVQNSQLLVAGQPAGEVSTEPAIFSPDNDGYNDVLNINYAFDVPGNVANITFFDPRGRTVRTLASNLLLGTQGTISWDGITDDGSKARIGMYLLYFEVFNANGDSRAIKQSVVLGGRL